MRHTILAVMLLTLTAAAQSNDTKLGDDYAKAALRALLAERDRLPSESVDRVVFLIDEADVEASTPAEEASFSELNRILGTWKDRTKRNMCFTVLKSALKKRDGTTPQMCSKEYQ